MQPHTGRRAPVLWVTILATVIVAAMVYSLVTGRRLAEHHAPLADAAMEVKCEATLGHLWFEEIISGDRERDVDVVWEHLDLSAWYARAMLEGGEDSRGVFVPLRDPALRREIEGVLDKIASFRAIAEERWEAAEQSGIGSPLDQRFDAMFESVLDQADRVEVALQDAMNRELRRFRTVQGFLIGLCLGLSVLIGVAFWRYERRRALDTAALQQGEERYRAIVEDNPVLICRSRPGGEITFVNRAYCEYFQRTPEELVGSSFFSLIPEEDRSNVRAGIETLTVDSPTQSHEHPVCAPDGSIRWQRWTNRALFDSRGRIVAYQSLGEDVTERRQSEGALREEHERAQAYLDLAGVMFVAIDSAGTVTLANRKACEVLEATEEEIVGTNWFDNYLPERLRERVKEVSELLKRGEIEPAEYYENPVLTKGGAERIIAWHNTVLRDDEGSIVGHLSSGEDVTERRQAEVAQRELEAQLSQAQRMEAVGQLAGGVAHDFNNLLQAILGYGEMALAETEEDGPARPLIEEIQGAGLRARTLVRQLLAFSRRQVLEMKDADLNAVIADMMKMIRRVIGAHITLELLPGHDLGTVRVDPGQIEQILVNLCVNARDAMPEGGTITIEIENVRVDDDFCQTHAWARPGRYVLMSLTDTGCGMDEETLASAFDPFFTTKGVGEGTGLGLSTVYGLVKQHQGMVHVYSEVGKGTTFKIYLPLVERAAAAVGDKIKSPVRGGAETILLAEDDEAVRALTEDVLRKAGYTVLVATEGREAIRVFEEHADEIDLALLDVVMPHVGGRAVFERIREHSPRVRALFCTGYSMNAIHTNFVLDEGLELIQKPYQRDDLLRRVREVLDGVEEPSG